MIHLPANIIITRTCEGSFRSHALLVQRSLLSSSHSPLAIKTNCVHGSADFTQRSLVNFVSLRIRSNIYRLTSLERACTPVEGVFKSTMSVVDSFGLCTRRLSIVGHVFGVIFSGKKLSECTRLIILDNSPFICFSTAS